MKISFAIGPKSCRISLKQVIRLFIPVITYVHALTRTQTCNAASIPGRFYLVIVEVYNHGIPYADAFYARQYYCMTRLSSRQSRLLVTAQTVYTRSVFGFVKSLIAKTSFNGMLEYFQSISTLNRPEKVVFVDVRQSVPNKLPTYV